MERDEPRSSAASGNVHPVDHGDCRLKGDGVHHAMRGITRMHNLALAG
jgi:hypothetical protein